jgi:nondiscriminating glutamyl-tRNA synthetase
MKVKQATQTIPRVRIAPSPTGPLHIGTARAALFNYLFAKSQNGFFILRIEDTDKERSAKQWEKNIIEGLKWLNLLWDEGPNPENPSLEIGDYGPYRQSQRKDIYQKYIQKLLDEDKAYFCFCSKEELEAQRQHQMSIGEAPRYTGTCRTMNKETINQNLRQKKPYVVRFKTPNETLFYNDLIKGKIEFNTSLFGDIAIAKNINSPLYNLAAVIDDYEMQITHVLRGEDHISNTPKQILLQEALGLPSLKYGHFPLILGPDKSKLSKRHGVVSISDYAKQGYLSEALVNIMTFLGWNPGTEKEIYQINTLIKEFSLERCHKSSAIFNIKKLNWFNSFYIRQKTIKKLTELCLPFLVESGLISPSFENNQHLVGIGPVEIRQKFIVSDTKEKITFEELEKIIAPYQERLVALSEISDLIDFFLKKNIDYEKNLLKWKEMDDAQLKEVLSALENILSNIKEDNWTNDYLQKALLEKAEKIGPKGDRGYLLWPLRAALSGKKASAGPFEIAEVLGKEKTLQRIKQAQEKLIK